ncbi:hypothetical protein [Marinobacter nauticus]|uniref:DUF4065 domain-containing protein n=1 Tax=Marinobacter nauticus TaxID=2743 RepID=A0A368V5K3_MARNT|nr:hypothetical protein [Marinobacter nauticus]RBP75540.1 hypothetical protein DET64_103140 [Marinobacter nauticus]RCW36349.1 hypothetical protein DET51_103140 [Marinobacter nauticus]
MSQQTTVLKRMIDVTISLATASRYHEKLNRIRLQKFIYLLDIVAYMYDVLPPAKNHVSYNNGPYDAAIQNAVDSLAFRGLIKISDVENSSSGKISCQYSLTEVGKKWAITLAEKKELRLRFDAANAVGKKVNKLGWWRLKDLVYAEPTYIQKRYSGFGLQIDTTDGTQNSAALLIGMFNAALEERSTNCVLNRELATELFFRYLDNFDSSQGQARNGVSI